MNDSPATSLSLLQRAQARQPAAWERLVDLYAPLVLYWCRRSGLNDADAADIFQEVFRSVAEKLNEFRRDRPGDTFRGWLRTVTRNKVLDLHRRRQHEPAGTGGSSLHQRLQAVPDPITEDDDPSETNLLRKQMQKALETIRPEVEERTWTAFWKVQIDNREPRDVAEEMGMTPAAVRKARYRILERLREELGELLE